MKMDSYIAIRKGILSDLRIWCKMTRAEKEAFKASKSEIQVDNYMTTFRHKYL